MTKKAKSLSPESTQPPADRLAAAAVAYAAAKRAVDGVEVGSLDPLEVAHWRKALIELEDASKAFDRSTRQKPKEPA